MPSLKAFLIYKIFVYLKTMAKPDDWALVDDLQEYVEGKVGTGVVRERTDWALYPGDPNLNEYI
jgi:hypothetical protein|tara:strand:- start:46 stop:237 length:192 start_codon:yes stop_codon:yes gene_type:complete